jgi:hypothetical protein
MNLVSTRRAVAGCAVVMLLAACGGTQTQPAGIMPQNKVVNFVSPQASVVANVTFRNKVSGVWVYAKVDWAYNGSPIWFNEAKTCIPPGGSWDTSVTYNRPDAGPQIRFRADAYAKKDCDGIFPNLQRELGIKDVKFKNGETKFDVEFVYYERGGFELCSSQKGAPEITCAWR